MRRLYSYLTVTKNTYVIDRVGERIKHTLLVAFGQSKILRKPFAGALHATVYWGFLVITVGTVEIIFDGLLGTHRILSFLGPVYDFVTVSGEIFAVLIIISVFIFLMRRHFFKPKRFIAPEMKPSSTTDATVILFMIFLLMTSLLGMNMGHQAAAANGTGHANPGFYPISDALLGMISLGDSAHLVGEINWWIHIVLVYAFLNILPLSKHFHVILSIPNVFLSRLTPHGMLLNLESVKKEVALMMSDDPFAVDDDAGAEEEEIARFGIKDIEDASWKNVIDSYTCTECGRCTASCPANITGKKLSPRKLYIDLRKRMATKGSELVKANASNEQYDDQKALVGDYITEEELWACTTCGACMQECPVNIEHVPFIVSMRQYLVMEESSAPEALNIMFNNIENNGAPWAMSPSARLDWAQEIYMPE